jgi:hypothetical protein
VPYDTNLLQAGSHEHGKRIHFLSSAQFFGIRPIFYNNEKIGQNVKPILFYDILLYLNHNSCNSRIGVQ